jgi:hypothetical protein
MNWGYVLLALLSALLFPLISRTFKLYEELDGRDELRRANLWQLIRAILRLGPIFSLALMAHYWIQRLTGLGTDSIGVQVLGVVLELVYIVPLFLILIPVVGRFTRKYGRAEVERWISVIVFLGFVLPGSIQQRNEDAAKAKREAAVRKLIDLEIGLRTRWSADIRAAGAHGPAGQVPPMVYAQPIGGAIEVDNLAGRGICLRIAGVSSPDPGGKVQRCDFQMFARTDHCLVVPASRSLTFVPQREECLQFPTEFRVGDFEHDKVAWWTDSGLRDFEDRTERLRQNLGVFSYREMSDDQLSTQISRLESMVPDARRGERWRADLDFWRRLRD